MLNRPTTGTVSPRSRVACIGARHAEWFHESWLLPKNVFPNERLGWLVYEIQHFAIYIHLQAKLVNEGGLNMRVAYPVNLFFKTNISLAQT